MSTLTVPGPALAPQERTGARFTDVLRSEWTKLRSIPSTMWTIVAALVVGIGLSALISAITAHAYAEGKADTIKGWDPAAMSTSGGAIAQLAIAVLGTMVITNEYATRAIRVSLAAVPHRGRLLAAKAALVAVVAAVISEVMAFASFLIGQAIISGKAPTASLSHPAVLRAVTGIGLYGAGIALFGLALGALLRSTAGAVSALVALLYVLPGLSATLPSGISHPIQKFWPTLAGAQITNVVPTPDALGPWAGIGVMALGVAVVLAAATRRLTHTDA